MVGEKVYRDGIELEKGVTLTQDFLIKNEKLFAQYANYFTTYPDLFLDLVKPDGSGFNLFFYQRIILRALMRYVDVFITAPRAAAKSFTTILALILQCVFFPGTTRFIAAPGQGQSAQIAKQKIIEIYRNFPILRREVIGGDLNEVPGNFGRDYVELKFRNGSRFIITPPIESTRGLRAHGGLIDEVRDHKEKPLIEIVFPLINVSRTLPTGIINPKEPNQQRAFMTSSASRSSYAYSILIDIFQRAIIAPKTSFCLGIDYRVPVLHGLIDKNYVEKLKMSPSYNPESFAREYMSLWSGGSEESWFKFDRLQRYRTLKNPQTSKKSLRGAESFYLLSTDVGRYADSTICSVFKVNANQLGYSTSLVNLISLGREDKTKTFTQQAIDLKMIIDAFDPLEVVIDTNGLGVGLADEMIKEHIGPDGRILPAYGFMNDENYRKIQPKGADNRLYSFKANANVNSQMHSNVYGRINSGSVRFLIKEQDARSALLALKKSDKMSLEKRTARLIPHEMTTLLFEEMANLRLRKSGESDKIVLEQINSRFPKDRYSSFAMGLWRIKELEEEYHKKRQRKTSVKRSLVFFN